MVSVTLGCSGSHDVPTEPSCNLQDAVSARAPVGATDCGYAMEEADLAAVNECARQALQDSNEPFVAGYFQSGIDSWLTTAVIRDDSGIVQFIMNSDGFCCGESIRVWTCPGATWTGDNPFDGNALLPIACDSQEDFRHICG